MFVTAFIYFSNLTFVVEHGLFYIVTKHSDFQRNQKEV